MRTKGIPLVVMAVMSILGFFALYLYTYDYKVDGVEKSTAPGKSTKQPSNRVELTKSDKGLEAELKAPLEVTRQLEVPLEIRVKNFNFSEVNFAREGCKFFLVFSGTNPLVVKDLLKEQPENRALIPASISAREKQSPPPEVKFYCIVPQSVLDIAPGIHRVRLKMELQLSSGITAILETNSVEIAVPERRY